LDLSRFQSQRVTVAVPDATRPIDPHAIEELIAGLVRVRAKPTILVALGLHRPMHEAELAPLGAIAAKHGALLLQHDAHDPDALVEIGAARFHRAIAEAEAVIAVGIVEPHQYAGFSGGVKTVAIGCAGRETIAQLHSLRLLRQPGTRIGCIDGNPFQAELRRLASPLQIWALQIVPDGGTYFGPAIDVFELAVRDASARCFEELAEELDWMHLEVPPAKAQSFYQASRAASYVALVDRPAIKRGGLLVVEARCPEGLGQGAGERAFVRALSRGRETLLEELEGDREIDGGEQRAYVLAMALGRARIAVAGAPKMPELEAFGIEALDAIPTLAGRGARSDPFRRLPRLGGRT
jgi:hypothetical protein